MMEKMTKQRTVMLLQMTEYWPTEEDFFSDMYMEMISMPPEEVPTINASPEERPVVMPPKIVLARLSS